MNYFFQKRFHIDECLRGSHAHLACSLVLCFFSISLISCSSTQTRPFSGTEFRDLTKDGSFGPQMVVIPAGTSLIGGIVQIDFDRNAYPEKKPVVHNIEMKYPFAIGKYEVTFAEFRAFVADSGYVTTAEKDGKRIGHGCLVYVRGLYWLQYKHWQRPPDASWRNPYYYRDIQDSDSVTCISWYDAVAYTEWLSEQTGERYRLPTDVEWEYAARGGKKSELWWLNKANPFGLHDMRGNLAEWVCSEYSVYSGAENSNRMLEDGELPPENAVCHPSQFPRNKPFESLPFETGSPDRYYYGNMRRPLDSTSKFLGFRVMRPLP